ncbi:nucleoside monophosphate kinase [Luteolibacter sp. GHJ8]|jgi:adenylate kinase|uniref:Adenylate kinase n=1 Tax=Luteolibacter rhizosphaerae TaxID=2989719 RepID=A0ABT3G7E3_9BACT|nr:nucleoside monophosphate kinase [Luteolibacter rhizosphaerae]MCW1915769.1 nucleoside monophosphate kinase [Luteolibacter rhizosphaerae]
MSKALDVKRPAFLILGAPGAGKGTQGKVLGSIPRFFHCACGDVFRSLDTRTTIGQRFVYYSSRGELVPDELTIELWKAQVDNWADSHVYKPDIDFLVLDGIPRNVPQAEMITSFLDIHQVFHLSCPDREELARRMRKRALKDNRIDDASDRVIQQRIATYEAETKPILEYFSDRLVTNIDATQPPVKVLHDIIGKIVSLPVFAASAQIVA